MQQVSDGSGLDFSRISAGRKRTSANVPRFRPVLLGPCDTGMFNQALAVHTIKYNHDDCLEYASNDITDTAIL